LTLITREKEEERFSSREGKEREAPIKGRGIYPLEMGKNRLIVK